MRSAKSSSVPWYSESAGFFGPDYLKEYTWLTPESTKTQVGFLVKTLKLKRGAKILDCPCGHGRHSIDLARRGYNVTGQDLNSFFLRKARADAKRAGVSIRWRRGDMREIPFDSEFDAVLNLFTSFGYLESDEEDQKALEQFAKALKPGGKLVIDIINRDRVIRSYRGKHWTQNSDGSLVIMEMRFDHLTGRNMETRTRISKSGERETFDLPIRMYAISELVPMLRRAGLKLQQSFGGYDGGAVTFDSPRYILIARKTGRSG